MFIMLNAPLLKDLLDELIAEFQSRSEAPVFLGRMPLAEIRRMAEDAYANIQQGTERIKNMVIELKDYAREKPADLDDAVDLNKVIHAAVTLTGNKIKNATDHFAVQYAADLPLLRGNAQRIEQVAINLLVNACEAMENKDQSITVATSYEPDENMAVIRVADQGCGMTPEILARIRDPFFTTKRDSGGTGLGVSISEKIIAEHEGIMVYDSQPGRGTLVTVKLPVSKPETGGGTRTN
jgi:two-component system NtrC family sensor kinase